MKSTCSYLRLKVTYFGFEDVGCIEVMGCVKKLSQTVPTGKDLEYWDSSKTGTGTNTVLRFEGYIASVIQSVGIPIARYRQDYNVRSPIGSPAPAVWWKCTGTIPAWRYWDEVQQVRSCNRLLSPGPRSGILGSLWDGIRSGTLGSGISIPRDPAGPETLKILLYSLRFCCWPGKVL